jgi:signal transduction histidine kinase
MILVWFVYGLAFFVLGVAILVYPKRDSRFDLARSIWMVGAFGIIHGLNEWLSMFIALGQQSRPLPPALLAEARVFTLAGSFFFLIQFGVTILSRHAGRRPWLCATPLLLVVGWLALVLTTEPSRRHLMADIWGRYLLCIPGTILTAWGLFSQRSGFRVVRLHTVTGHLGVAAVTFLLYGVFAGLFVRKADFFPATVFNYENFIALTGAPVQIFRTFCAVVVAWSIVRILDVFRWETQEALRVSDLRCATVASALPVFLFMTDRNLVVTFIQGKGLEGLGVPPEQLRDRPVAHAFPSGATLAEDCRRALAGEEFITTVALNDASFEIYYSALRDAAGVVTNVIGVALDVSAQMKVRHELEEYRRRMEKHAREAAVGVLSATMARQVVEPLTVTQLMLEQAVADLARAGVPPTVQDNISRSLAEMLKAHETLERFMEIAHPDAGAAEQPVGLYQIARRTMSVFADSARRRRLIIAIKEMDIVPLMAIPPREVEQIFYHLMQRALDAADGAVEQKLVIRCVAGDGYIDLLFCGTCDGFGPKESEHALDPGVDYLEAVDGSGLSLAVTKRIVGSYGGQITADAGPDNTTTFTVRLPVKRVYGETHSGIST